MAKWTKEQGQEALATISTLKRVLRIPNHPTMMDTFVEKDVHIYTSDVDSATLIAEMLYRYGTGNRAAHYAARPDIMTVRDTIQIELLPEGGWDVSMNVTYAPSLKKALEKMIQKHIAPDTRLTR